jgi:hypothetical protein
MNDLETRLRRLYDAFNARDIDTVLGAMTPDVDWPNGMEGTREIGHDAVRAYWLRQWDMIEPHVEPVGFSERPGGHTAIEVHQVIRDLQGNVLNDRTVRHVYEFDGELVSRMDIEEA